MKRSPTSPVLLAAVFLACSTGPKDEPTARADDAEDRRASERQVGLAERLEQARVEGKVPGMAVAVVSHDAVLFARGFGVADLERGTPVRLDTQFAIGSATKAFTSTAVGMLCDEGLMDWDAPISRYLPQLDLPDVTVVDLATHRSGRARKMDLMLLGMKRVDRDTLFSRVAAARTAHEPGTRFEYLNIGYIALGEASASASGVSWDQLIRTRVFDPLGMNDSHATPPRPEDDLAMGYQWQAKQERHQPRPARGRSGGAGAIRSTANDMARWLQFQLANGQVDGTRLIAADTLTTTRSPLVEIHEDLAYGAGWLIQEDGWNGHRVIEHRGNTDGFSAVVAMIPDEDVGVVMLMNQAHSGQFPLPDPQLVWEELLTDPPAGPLASDEDYGDLVGTYRGSIPGSPAQRFDFFVRDGVLMGSVDIEGIPATVVETPDARGRRALQGVPGLSVSFVRGPGGTVDAFRLHQEDFVFELFREGVTAPIEVIESEVAGIVGSYRSESGAAVDIRVENGRLAIERKPPSASVPPGSYALHLPDADGRWRYRSNPHYAVTFGPQMLTLDDAGQTVQLHKLEQRRASSMSLVPIEAVVACRRPILAAVDATVSLQIERTLDYAYAGLTGTGVMRFGVEHSREAWDFGDFGHGTHTVDRGVHKETTTLEPFEGLQARLVAAARAEQPFVQFGDWRAAFDTVEVIGQIGDAEHTTAIVRLSRADGSNLVAHVDVATGDVRQLEQRSPMPGLDTDVPLVTTFSDFRPTAGIRVPHHVETVVAAGFNVMTETVTRVSVEPKPEGDR